MTLRRVVVTGGNTGIGFALCKQLVSEDDCHVYLGARTESKGVEAVNSIKEKFPSSSIEYLAIDVDDQESVTAAAAATGGGLYALVNNAGIGLAHGVSSESIVATNFYGAKRVSDAFIPLLTVGGRVVNLGSGAASSYVTGSMMGKPMGSCTAEEKEALCDSLTTLDKIETVLNREKADNYSVGEHWCAYGLSKAALTAYTMVQARECPGLVVSVVSPGFIATKMTAGFNAKLTPEQGTVSIRHALFNVPIEKSGFYWGSDAKRSPLDCGRDPGEPEYDP